MLKLLLTHEKHRQLETFDLASIILVVELEVLLAVVTLHYRQLSVRVRLFLVLSVRFERLSAGLPIQDES